MEPHGEGSMMHLSAADVGSPGEGCGLRGEERRVCGPSSGKMPPLTLHRGRGRAGLSREHRSRDRVRSSAQQTNVVCFRQASKVGFRGQWRAGGMGAPPQGGSGRRDGGWEESPAAEVTQAVSREKGFTVMLSHA